MSFRRRSVGRASGRASPAAFQSYSSSVMPRSDFGRSSAITASRPATIPPVSRFRCRAACPETAPSSPAPPAALGIAAPRQRPALRAQIGVLAGRSAGVRYPRNMGGEVQQPIDRARRGKQQPAQVNRIEPLERCPFDGSVIQVEAIDIDPCSHLRPPQKARATPGSGP